jgi:cytoskeletal protein CcmA (bactofilin family)
MTTYSAVPELADQTSSISAGMTVVGKISGEGTVKIHGKVEGEIHAVNVLVSDGASVVGDINAQELTIGGRFKGNIHATRVTLKSTAIVEGEIFHQSLAIEENAQFEGVSRRESGAGDNASRSLKKDTPATAHSSAFEAERSLNGSSNKESYVDRPLG